MLSPDGPEGKYEFFLEEMVWSIIEGNALKEDIKDTCVVSNEDPLVFLLTGCYDYVIRLQNDSKTKMFIEQITTFAQFFIEEENEKVVNTYDDSKYQWRMFSDRNGTEMSLLHIAAERNLLSIAEILLEHYPNLLYLKTESDKNGDGSDQGKFPVELAIRSQKNIEVTAFLVSKMTDTRVDELFENKRNANARLWLLEYLDRYIPPDRQDSDHVVSDSPGFGKQVSKKWKDSDHVVSDSPGFGKQVSKKWKKVAEKLKEKSQFSGKQREPTYTVEPYTAPQIRRGVIIHTEESQWKTVKILKDLLSIDRCQFDHMIDVHHNSDGENFEEKLRNVISTCTAVLVICSPSVCESIKSRERISVEHQEKLSFCFDSSILGEYKEKSITIILEVRESSEGEVEEDGISSENMIINFVLEIGQNLNHALLKRRRINERITSFMNKIQYING